MVRKRKRWAPKRRRIGRGKFHQEGKIDWSCAQGDNYTPATTEGISEKEKNSGGQSSVTR